MAFRVYQDPRSPAQWAIGADWALGMADAGQLAVWLSLPDCAEPEVVAIDAAHWDQLLRRVPPARMVVASGTLPDQPVLIAVLICVMFADLMTAVTLVLLLLLVGKITEDDGPGSGSHAAGPEGRG